MTFEEVVSQTKSNPQASYVAFFIRGETYLGFYAVSGDEDEPGWVNVHYEGGHFYSSVGEEEFYELGTAPDEVKQLKFVSQEHCPDAAGYTAEHVASNLFPELPDPEGLMSQNERADFVKKARDRMAEEWVVL